MSIKAGTESLIKPQFNDYIIDVIKDNFINVKELLKSYHIDKSINKKEFKDRFDILSKEFEESCYERFGLNIRLRDSNMFAVLPIVNDEVFNSNMLHNSLNADVKHAYKQMRDFKKFIEKDSFTIDLNSAKIKGLDKDTYFPLFINSRSIVFDNVDMEDYTAIVLHEIGHVFTLLEMYSKTNRAINSLSNNLLKHNDINGVLDELEITSHPNATETDKIIMVYNYMTKDMLNITDSRNNDDTDVEYEADNFTAAFGYGGQLVKALNNQLRPGEIPIGLFTSLFIFYNILNAVLIATLISIFIVPISMFTTILVMLIGDLIINISKTIIRNSKRNPTNDEHGSILERYVKIKTSMIAMLRENDLDRKDKKMLISSINDVEEGLKILEKSTLNSYIGGLISEKVGVNFNIQDRLADTLDRLINNDLYVSKTKFEVGLESVSYSGRKDPIVNDLLKLVNKLLDQNIVENVTQAGEVFDEMSEVIYERFGIPTLIANANYFGVGFSCLPFSLTDQYGLGNINNKVQGRYTLSALYTRPFGIDSNFELLKDLNNGLKITVDNDKKYIKGLDKKRHRSLLLLELGRDDFYLKHTNSSIALKPLEIVAIILHEIGHLFTHTDALVRTVRTNSMLQEYLLDNNKVTKTHIIENDERFIKAKEKISSTSGNLSYTIMDMFVIATNIVSSILNLNFAGNPAMVILDTKDSSDRLGDYNTYNTDSEVLADNFATSFGLGDELTHGLKRMITYNNKSILLYMLPSIVALAKSIFIFGIKEKKLKHFGKILINSLIYSMGLYAMFLIARMVLNEYFPYEKLPERFDSIKRSLIKIIRDTDLDTDSKKEILKSLKVIEQDIEDVIEAGYSSFLLNIFSINVNGGVTFKNNKILTDMLDKMINNDLHLKGLEFEVGLESKKFLEDVTVFYTEFEIDKDSYKELFIKNRSTIKKINDSLKDYNIELEYTKEDGILGIKSKKLLRISSGITTIAFMPKDKENLTSIVTMTVEPEKVLWLLENPYIKVYDIDILQVSDIKYIYIVDVEYLTKNDKQTKTISKIVDKIDKSFDKLYDDYGVYDFNTQIKLLKELKGIPNELKEQIILLEYILTKIDKNPNARLDLHTGNFSYNSDGKLVLLDPIYNPTKLARKQSNYISLDLSKLNKKD